MSLLPSQLRAIASTALSKDDVRVLNDAADKLEAVIRIVQSPAPQSIPTQKLRQVLGLSEKG